MVMWEVCHLDEGGGMKWQKTKSNLFCNWVPGWIRGAHPELTTGCPAPVQNELFKMFQGELFVPYSKQGQLCLNKMSQLTVSMEGVHPLLLLMFISPYWGACSSPRCLPFHGFPHQRAAFYHSAARPTWGLLLGQSYMPWHLWDSWETPGLGSTPGPATSPPQICSVSQIGFPLVFLFKIIWKVQVYPHLWSTTFCGLKMHNILNHYSLFRQRFFSTSKNLLSLFTL